jgi:hypothetical protein
MQKGLSQKFLTYSKIVPYEEYSKYNAISQHILLLKKLLAFGGKDRVRKWTFLSR